MAYSKKGNKIPVFVKGNRNPVAWVYSYDHPGARPNPFVMRTFQTGMEGTIKKISDRLFLASKKALEAHRNLGTKDINKVTISKFNRLSR